jgi:hypothetical protein
VRLALMRAPLSAEVSAFLANGTIEGFFLGDELVWNGLNMSSLYFYADTMRRMYPNATLWYNEAVPPMMDGQDVYGRLLSRGSPKWPSRELDLQPHIAAGHPHNYSIPPSLDWISIDMYHTAGPSATFVQTFVRPFYTTYVYPKASGLHETL